MWQCLWRGARRGHPHKGAWWVRKKYFQTDGFRGWVFAVKTGELLSNGKPKLIALRDICDTKIRRHRKIKADANPFDPQWETYFEQRFGFKLKDSLQGRKKLIRLWMEQGGRCPVCSQPLTETSGWHVHHLVRRVDGGPDINANLVMVHPNCHNQIHVNGLKVVKPVRESGL